MSDKINACVETLREILPQVKQSIVDALAPKGVLRAGINLSNFLLVTDKEDDGTPVGVSPDMAKALGEMIGRDVELITFGSPGEVADAAEDSAWDIGNIGAEPARAKFINFADAYCEIESTFLVPSGSSLNSVSVVDAPGVRIATKARAAYTLWLERNLEHAELVQFETADAAFEAFVDQDMQALAGLRPRLLDDTQVLTGSRILEEKFASVQQAMGTPTDRDPEGLHYLRKFVAGAKFSGLVAALIEKHGVQGKLSVAP